jgi:hypothetical protein
MYLRVASIVLTTVLAVCTSVTGSGAVKTNDQAKKQGPAGKAEQGSSLTGCVDQQDGLYVLVDDRNLTPIADLVAEGFPAEGFAKHVGHKVTVRGTSNAGGARTVIKVRSIQTVSDTCEPQKQEK